jgi:hypothetical protein
MSRRRYNSQSSEDRVNECLQRIETYTQKASVAEHNTSENANLNSYLKQIDYYLDVIKEVYKAKFKRKF